MKYRPGGHRRRLSYLLASAVILVLCCSGIVGAVEKGAPAPDFSLPDLAGNTVSLSQFKGKVVVVNFFTIWCQPCRHEMPDLNAIYKDKRDKGFQMLGICLNADPNQLKVLVKQLNLDYPVLLGTDKVSKDYGEIVGVPTTFIIDKQGKIAEKIVGARKKEEFLALITPLL